MPVNCAAVSLCILSAMRLIFYFSVCLQQNFAAQYDGVKAPDPGPGPMVRGHTLILDI